MKRLSDIDFANVGHYIVQTRSRKLKIAAQLKWL
jgi:hypothetical protein